MGPVVIVAFVSAGVAVAPLVAMLSLADVDGEGVSWRQRPMPATGVWALMVVAGLLSGLVGATDASAGAKVVGLAFAFACSVLAVVDAERHRLPDRLMVVAAAIAVAGFVAVAAIGRGGVSLVRPVFAGLAVFAILYAVAFATAGGVGLGDVKLSGVLAVYLGWFGWPQVVVGLAVGYIAAGLWAISLLASGRADRRSQIPLGPFLIAATFVVAAAG